MQLLAAGARLASELSSYASAHSACVRSGLAGKTSVAKPRERVSGGMMTTRTCTGPSTSPSCSHCGLSLQLYMDRPTQHAHRPMPSRIFLIAVPVSFRFSRKTVGLGKTGQILWRPKGV